MKKNHWGGCVLLLALLLIGASNVPAEQPPRFPPLSSEKVITITSSQLDPAQLTIDRGEEVIWEFLDQPATVLFDHGSYPSRIILSGERLSFYFIEPGTYEYTVSLRGARPNSQGPAMLVGRITVR